MTTLRLLPLLLTLGLTVPAAAQQKPESTDAKIAALDDSWVAAYNAGNATELSHLTRDGARWRIFKSIWSSCLPGCRRS